MKSQKWFLPIVAVLISLPAAYSLFTNPGYYSMHDFQHIGRLFVLKKALFQFDFFPRWVDYWGFGFGNPLFNFYPPLFSYIALIFTLIGFNLITSIKIAIAVGFAIGSVGTYYLGKKLTNSVGGLISAAAFTYFGYRAVTIYVRGAFSEFLATSIIPISLYLLLRMTDKSKSNSIMLFSFSIAGIMLSHQIIALPFIMIMPLVIFVLSYLSKDKKKFIIHGFLGLILGLGLSSFFWLPASIEKQYTTGNMSLISENAQYKNHFVYPIQLWYSPWNFGGSATGLDDGISFQLGKLYIYGALLSFIWFLYMLTKKERIKKQIYLYCVFLILTIVSIGMTLEISQPFWRQISIFSYIQFPWRFLSFTSLGMSILIIFPISYFIEMVRPYFEKYHIVIPIIVIFIITAIIGKNIHYFQPKKFLNKTEKQLSSFEEIAWTISNGTFEFSPKGIKSKRNSYGVTVPDFPKSLVIPHKELTVMKGTVSLLEQNVLFRRKSYRLSAKNNSVVRFHTFNFPGWEAYIDNKRTIINDGNEYKLITLTIPKGEHVIDLYFKNTPVRKVSLFISALSLGVVLIFPYRHFHKIS